MNWLVMYCKIHKYEIFLDNGRRSSFIGRNTNFSRTWNNLHNRNLVITFTYHNSTKRIFVKFVGSTQCHKVIRLQAVTFQRAVLTRIE